MKMSPSLIPIAAIVIVVFSLGVKQKYANIEDDTTAAVDTVKQVGIETAEVNMLEVDAQRVTEELAAAEEAQAKAQA
ncbi:MAG: hypothetical protein AB8B64_18850, partial [Granulosicoccus sp.]